MFTYVSSFRGHKDVTQDRLLINTATQSESLERFRKLDCDTKELYHYSSSLSIQAG